VPSQSRHNAEGAACARTTVTPPTWTSARQRAPFRRPNPVMFDAPALKRRVATRRRLCSTPCDRARQASSSATWREDVDARFVRPEIERRVDDVWIQVHLTGPNDCAGLLIDLDLLKQSRVAQLLIVAPVWVEIELGTLPVGAQHIPTVGLRRYSRLHLTRGAKVRSVGDSPTRAYLVPASIDRGVGCASKACRQCSEQK
jgi:hypothetical protein